MPPKTVAQAFDKIENHEELCAERYQTIHEKLGDLKNDARLQGRMIIGVLLALLGWMAAQLIGPLVHPQPQTQTIQVAAPRQ